MRIVEESATKIVYEKTIKPQPVPERRDTNRFLASLDSLSCDKGCKYFDSPICNEKAICQMARDIVAEHDAAVAQTARNELLDEIVKHRSELSTYNCQEMSDLYDLLVIDEDEYLKSLRRGGE